MWASVCAPVRVQLTCAAFPSQHPQMVSVPGCSGSWQCTPHHKDMQAVQGSGLPHAVRCLQCSWHLAS